MLKLSSRNSLIIWLIIVGFICNCSDKKDNVQEQKMKLDTVSGIAPKNSARAEVKSTIKALI